MFWDENSNGNSIYIFFTILYINLLMNVYKQPYCQGCILEKDSNISLSIFYRMDFVSKTIARGVSLQGVTSKRDSIYISPALACINPNLIPVNRTSSLGNHRNTSNTGTRF
jgi:hypothetical protein